MSLSDQLFAIVAWMFVGVMASCVVLMLGGFWVMAIYCAKRRAFVFSAVVFVLAFFFTLAMTASIIRIGEHGGSYTDVWTLLRA